MFEALTRREVVELLAGYAAFDRGGGSGGGKDGNGDGHRGAGGPTLNRFATTALGAEITGLFVTDRGQFFFNVQHPDRENDSFYDEGTIGAVAGLNVHELPEDFGSLQLPANEAHREEVRVANGSYQPLAQGGDETDDGGSLGIPTTPDGTPLTEIEGTEYADYGYAPDFNGFVPVNESGTRGYLFTNFETTPGMITRLELRWRSEKGMWRVCGVKNVDMRSVEGTMINCFGSVSPWGTPLSAEENYAEVATPYWNAPNPSEADDDGAWALAGVEKLAYYLGAEPGQDVIDDVYPNPYRYGYIVEIEEPTASEPEPRKLFTFGRAAHENAVVMPDEKTAYATSDGSGKLFYKFVADEAGDLTAGTLYAAKAQQKAPIGADAADAGFDLEWIELGHGTNEEIERKIAEYDDVTQRDYVENVENGDEETSYVTDEEIMAWAHYKSQDKEIPERLRYLPFIESRKCATALGATDEFRKMEGVNVRPGAEPGDYLYLSMSEVNETMSDLDGDIKLEGNDYGTVYRMRLNGSYDVHRMEPAITGGPEANVCGGCPYDARPDSGSAVCQSCEHNPTREDEDGTTGNGTSELAGVGKDLLTDEDGDDRNAIANPDNVVVLPDGRVIIGEDTGFHDNNMIWVFDPGEE